MLRGLLTYELWSHEQFAQATDIVGCRFHEGTRHADSRALLSFIANHTGPEDRSKKHVSTPSGQWLQKKIPAATFQWLQWGGGGSHSKLSYYLSLNLFSFSGPEICILDSQRCMAPDSPDSKLQKRWGFISTLSLLQLRSASVPGYEAVVGRALEAWAGSGAVGGMVDLSYTNIAIAVAVAGKVHLFLDVFLVLFSFWLVQNVSNFGTRCYGLKGFFLWLQPPFNLIQVHPRWMWKPSMKRVVQ